MPALVTTATGSVELNFRGRHNGTRFARRTESGSVALRKGESISLTTGRVDR